MPPKRKPLADKNCDTEQGSSVASTSSPIKTPKAKKPRARASTTTKEVGPIRGQDADYSSLKLTKICAAKKKATVLKLLDGIKPGLSEGDGRGDCVKEAIRKGFLDISGTPDDLQKVVFKDIKPNLYDLGQDCSCKIDVTLEMLLDQMNQTGTDYEDGLPNSTIFCKDHEDEGRCVISDICNGDCRVDCGKASNHCSDGKCGEGKFGKCIGDYREAHCWDCNKHYLAGLMGNFECRCGNTGSGEGGDGDCVMM